MEHSKKRWSYLCQPLMRGFLDCTKKEDRQQYLDTLDLREQEILSLNLLTAYMRHGSFLHFFRHCDLRQARTVIGALHKINASAVGVMVEQSYQILEPALRRWPECTVRELLHRLSEVEKQKLYVLDKAYKEHEQNLLLHAYCYYAGGSR